MTLSRSFLLLCLITLPVRSQMFDHIRIFPDTAYISTFVADPHTHRMRAENIVTTKNVRATMGGEYRVFAIDLFGTTVLAGFGAAVHFELQPMGQAHVVSDDYYVDYLLLDVPLAEHLYTRFVTGHTSHHLSDNWYERLKLTEAFRYSRDYVKLQGIYEAPGERQFYVGADYAYIMTIGQRLSKPWIFQSGGRVPLSVLFDRFTIFAAADVTLRQEAHFAATNTIQAGITVPMQPGRNMRFSLQYRKGLDERGQFLAWHRELTTLGFSIE